MDGRERVVTDWVSESAAREAALKNTWNSDYTLYIVTLMLTHNGQIIEDEQMIEDIPCGRERARG